MRRTFVCLGDAVNLSARLMSAASPGQIYVSRTVHDAAGDAFAWETLPALKVKGKQEPVEVFALTGSVARISRRQVRYELPLVGRRAELQRARPPPRRGAGRARPGGGDRRRGGHGQVAPGRRVRPLRPPRRTARGLRRVPGVRDHDRVPAVARTVAQPARRRGGRTRSASVPPWRPPCGRSIRAWSPARRCWRRSSASRSRTTS